MKAKTLMSLAAAAAVFGAAADLSAAITYEYRSAEPVYGSAPGGTIVVDLYFHEALNGSPSLLASEDGLDSLTVRVTRTAGNATIASAAANPAFNDPDFTSTSVTGGGTVATLDLAVRYSPTGSGVGVASDDGVYLGSVTLANGTAPSTFAFNTTGKDTVTFRNLYNLELPPESNGLPAGTYAPAGTSASTFVATLLGDATLDGRVDVADLGTLATYYGASGTASWTQGDFTYDRNVDVADLGLLATYYGSGTGLSPVAAAAQFRLDLAAVAADNPAFAAAMGIVPEPTSLAALAGVGILSRRRRRRD